MAQNLMDISIIVPCHNLEQYIERCLKSILMQQYSEERYEIIVVLDACHDDTKRIVAEILKSRAQDKILSVNFFSPGLSRNFGLDMAEGQYVWFIDGDDYLIDDQAFSKLIDLMQKRKASTAYLKTFVSEEPITENWAVWRFFYERRFIGETRFPDLPINEDIEFFRSVSQKRGFHAAVMEDVLYHHTYPREGSIVTEKNLHII